MSQLIMLWHLSCCDVNRSPTIVRPMVPWLIHTHMWCHNSHHIVTCIMLWCDSFPYYSESDGAMTYSYTHVMSQLIMLWHSSCCDVNHSRVRPMVPWLIHTHTPLSTRCRMPRKTYSHVWHDTFTCVLWRIHVCHTVPWSIHTHTCVCDTHTHRIGHCAGGLENVCMDESWHTSERVMAHIWIPEYVCP